MNYKVILLTVGTCIAFSHAKADLLIDPSNSTLLQSNGNFDNVVSTNRSLGFTGSFFGVSRQSVDVSTNGNLNFTGNTASMNTPMPTGVGRINPLWDDLAVSGTSESVSEKVVSGMYYAVTWQAHQRDTGADVRFQATWFGAPTQIKGFSFLSGDIAFSYRFVTGNFSGGDATIGLDSGNGIHFVPLPGDDDGSIKNGLVTLLPTGTGQFMLFRPNGASYNASIQVAPEPSTWTLSLVAIGAILYHRQQRKRKA